MSRTYSPLTGDGTGDAFDAGSRFGYQSAEKIRQGLDLLAYIGDATPLGGDPSVGFVTGAATWEAVNAALAHSIDGDNLGGMTIDLVVTTWTQNAAQAVQARLRNTTDGSNAAVSTSHSSTSPTTEIVSVTLASGNKSYRLEVLGGATHAVFCVAYLRVRRVPA
jgi:hypothetical protein